MKLLWVLVLSMLFITSMGQLLSRDILALLEFKKGIKHDPTGFVLNSWNEDSIDSNGCPGSWNGIVCNGEHVAGVVLNNLGLTATIDLSLFLNLTMLVKLSLSKNFISSTVPDNISDLTNLEVLDLSDNLFSLPLPSGIGKIASLRNISLAGNNFSGPIPDSISGLVSLKSLDFSRNSFSGPLPKSLTKLSNLLYMNLSYNGFTETIPSGFEMISGLQIFDLRANRLEGHLDGEFFLLSNASHVDLSGNMLMSSSQGKLLPGISESIKYLNLSCNKLDGSLVGGGEVSLFENLKILDLSYNKLSGELPGFDFVYELQVLKISNNEFIGSIPNNLLKGDSLFLTELDLSGNNLSGPISMIMSTNLRVLNLSSNALNGELPPLIGSTAVLDLSNNQFDGNLTKMVKWENVEYVDLSQNHLLGSVPEVLPRFLRLNHLNLSHNKLEGPLPELDTKFPKLILLDFGSNHFSGSVPADIFSMPILQELHLQNNVFTSVVDVPKSSLEESNIQILDLSHNQLSGYFPNPVLSLTRLQVLNVAANNLSGPLPTSMAGMSYLSSLDVSANRFTGSLPENLSSNLTNLNISHNYLSGVVPKNLLLFPTSSFYPGNKELHFPPGTPSDPGESSKRKETNKIVIVVGIIVSCVVAPIILILLAIFVYYIRKSRDQNVTSRDIHGSAPSTSGLVVSATDLLSSQKLSSAEILSPDSKLAGVTGYSPSKNSHLSWSPGSMDSPIENLARLNVRSPEKLIGDLYFLDDTITLTPEELSRAPAEVLGRSSHGTSYKATLDSGMLLTVKWLREGVAKQRKEFAKEAKKFANIRHPNVVTLRGYYWGPTQHEKLILSDYISPGSLAGFLYDRPRRQGPPLPWTTRLRIAVDISRGLNYLHFDRAMPHGNLKASNILLDGPDLNARVADYCLHRLMTQAGTFEQILDAGILGYRAPELAASKKPVPSFKSDIYAFGVVMLELLTGRCAGDFITGEQQSVDLTEWVGFRVAEGRGSECIDVVLMSEISNPGTEKGIKEVLGIAMKCIRSVSERPGIKTVYEDLSSI